jgi:hypothetical protein
MGRRVSCTPDHPFVVTDREGSEVVVKRADQLDELDWLPLAQGLDASVLSTVPSLDVRDAVSAAGLAPRDVIVRPAEQELARVLASSAEARDQAVAWVRVTSTSRSPYDGFVYSLEVPRSSTFVTTGGLVVHNCFPKDVSALKQLAGNSGYHFQLLTAVVEVNELQKRRVVNKLKRHLGSLVGKRIALLGLAFKPNTDDMREASSVVLAARLQAEGAIVRAYDPVAEKRAAELLAGVEMCASAMEAIDGANAVVIVTEWPEFGELDLVEVKQRMADPVIVDGRNVLSMDAARAAGLVYEGIGRT